jgi:hypothetical protein
MKHVYQTLSLAPAPAFFIGLIWNLSQSQSMCGAGNYEMAVMWAVMALAHTTPWIIWWQQRNFSRD